MAGMNPQAMLAALLSGKQPGAQKQPSMTSGGYNGPIQKGVTLSGKVTIAPPEGTTDTPAQQSPMANLTLPTQKAAPQPATPPPAAPTGQPSAPSAQALQSPPSAPQTMTPEQLLAADASARQAIQSKLDALKQPTYQKPKLSTAALIAAGVGLLSKGGIGSPLFQGGTAALAGGVQRAEKDYQRAEDAYKTNLTTMDTQLRNVDTDMTHQEAAQQAALNAAEKAQHDRAVEAVARQNAATKFRQVDVMHQHYQQVYENGLEANTLRGEANQIRRQQIASTAANVAAVTQRDLTIAGMRDDTAVNVAQLRGAIEVATANARIASSERNTDARDATQLGKDSADNALKANMGAMKSVQNLITQATNPKNPMRTQAMAALQKQMADPNSPYNSVVTSLKNSGMLGDSIADGIMADSEAYATLDPNGQPQAAAPTVNVNLGGIGVGVPGAPAPTGGVPSGTVDDIFKRYGLHTGGAGGAQNQGQAQHAATNGTPATPPVDPGVMSQIKAHYTQVLAQVHDPEKAWQQTAAGIKGASAQALQSLHDAIVGKAHAAASAGGDFTGWGDVGSGAPHPKN